MTTTDVLPYAELAPDTLKAMYNLEAAQRHSSLEQPLRELVKMRASQINGCAYCLDMHTKDARLNGEREQRIYALPVWRETPFYSDRERAALAWTEALTLLPGQHVTEEAHAQVRQHFTEQEVVDLTFTIATINTWNRLMIGFRAVAGTYKPEAAR